MPLTDNDPLLDTVIYSFNPVLGTPTGGRHNARIPVRGRLMEAGFVPNSLVASAITLAVAISSPLSSAASNFTQVITSTLGTFSSTNLYEGAVASVVPATFTAVNKGDTIQWTASGGNTSAIAGTMYAVIRRG